MIILIGERDIFAYILVCMLISNIWMIDENIKRSVLMKNFKLILLLLVLLSIPTMCMARKSVPFMTGVIVNNQNEVVAVQVNSPAYNIGLRPLDKITRIISVDKSVHTSDIKQIIDTEGEKTFEVEFLHKQSDNYNLLKGVIKAKNISLSN